MSKETIEPEPLAQSLSSDDAGCPIPSAHDKASEAHYFLHQMIDNYHSCDRFRYSLSAFLQASRSVTFHMQAELAHRAGFIDWYSPWQKKLIDNNDLKLLNSERVKVVHKEALIPASSIFVGAFEYGRQRFGFSNIPLNPMQDSIPALIARRGILENGPGGTTFIGPDRGSNCEEYGLTRTWSLPDLKGVELVDFCVRAFGAILEVVVAAHEWCGARLTVGAPCNHQQQEYRTLRESSIFPEVMKAWDGPPTERVLATDMSLPLLAMPWEGAEVLYNITPKKIARGWVSGSISPFWEPQYTSMLVYSYAGRRLRFRNSVFFDRRLAHIEPSKSSRY
jgi:hypothetical protein